MIWFAYFVIFAFSVVGRDDHGLFNPAVKTLPLNHAGQWPASRRLRAGPRPAESARPSRDPPPLQGLGLKASTARGSIRWNPPQGLDRGLLQGPSKAAGDGVFAATQGGPVKLWEVGTRGPWVSLPQLRRQGGVHSHPGRQAPRRPRGNRRLRKRYRGPGCPSKPRRGWPGRLFSRVTGRERHSVS